MSSCTPATWVCVDLLDTRPARRAGASGAARAYPDVDVLVFGHGHIPWDTTTDAGLRLLNPGSPTDRRRQPTHT